MEKIVVSVRASKVYTEISGKVYLLEQSEKEYANEYVGFTLPSGNANKGTILVKDGTKNVSQMALSFVERADKNTAFDKFTVGEYGKDKVVGSIYTPKTSKAGKANGKVAKGSKAVASHTGKANKAVMAEILATQAHLAELIASIS